jgi:hypothetical protein
MRKKMNTVSVYRNSFWTKSISALLIIMLMLLALPVTTALAAPATDGDGQVTVSPTSVAYGSGTGSFTFTFTANNDFVAGSQVEITIPAGWTAPTTAAGAGHISWFPGASCTFSGSPPVAVSGMNILIDIASCSAGNSFTITYTSVTPGPVSLTPYTFVAQTDIGPGGAGLVPTTAPAPTVSVDPKTLTLTGVTTNPKVYDGGTSATLNFGAASLVGVVSPDVVNLVTTGYTANFNTKHVGTTKPVTISGLTLGGANAGNYLLTQPSSSGNITQKPITVTAVSSTKTYDGTVASAGLPTLSGATPLAPGDIEPVWTQTFNSKHAGAGKVLTPAGLVSDGNSGNNYSYTYATVSTGTIDKRPLTVIAETDTKTYDGSTSSVGAPFISGAIASGDTAPVWTQTFDNKNIGTGKVLTPDGLVNDGNSGNNYVYLYLSDTTGVIHAKALTVSSSGLTPANKTYDGTTSASLTIGTPSLVGVVSPDAVTLVTTGAAGAFVDRNFGAAKTVNISGLTLGGAGAGNYTLTQPTRIADITKRPVTITAATETKTYDGAASSSGVPTLSGSTPLAAGDSEPAWSQTFNNKNAGTAKVLTPAGLVNDGNGGSNYAYTYATVSTGVINKKSITITAVSDTKAYDSLVTSNGLPLLSGATPLVPGDTAPVWSQAFANKNVGSGKTIIPAGLVNDGNSGGNYAYNYVPDVSGVITARAITVTALVDTKTYDGTTASSLAPHLNPALVGSDTSAFIQTFDTAAVGVNKTITPSGTVNDGNSGLNYAISFAPAISTGVINARSVTITADAKSKVIGATDPALTYLATSGSLAVGDSLTLVRAAGETVGTYPITINSFPASSNYTLTYVGANLTITPIVTINSTGAYDGWILESTRTSSVGGSMNSNAATFQLGDDVSNRQYRGILSFDTSSLPANAVITSVVIKIKQSGLPTGTNPFKALGGLLVDICKGSFGGANALSVKDFQATPTVAKVGTFSATPVAGWYSVSLTGAGLTNINLPGVTQFRLYFTKGDNNNAKADFMKFISGNSAANQPQLIITYTLQP